MQNLYDLALLGIVTLLFYRLWRRIAIRKNQRKAIPEALFHYRYHDSSTKEEQLMAHIQALLPYVQILLCPSPHRNLDKFDGIPGLFILPQDKPARSEFLKIELSYLKQSGAAALLIDGLDSLASTPKGETKEMALKALGTVIYMEEPIDTIAVEDLKR